MKVILYYPPITPHTHFPTWEPLQLVFLVRALRSSGIDAEIIDGRLCNEPERNTLLKQKISEDTLCVGITSLTCYQFIDALNVAQYVKEQFPKIPVILGGWHATIFPEETLEENGIDVVIRGQGEITFLEVLDRIQKNNDFKGVRGVSWKRRNSVFHEEDRPLTPPDQLPPLIPSDFEKLELRYYQLNNVLFYMSSTGCPYSCKYCCVSLSCKRKWIPLSAERVIQELDGLHDAFGFGDVVFWDNVFFPDRKRVEQICEHIIHKKLPLSWSAHGRINEIITWDDSFIRLLRESGCKSIFIGAESGSQRLLDSINKRIKGEDIVPAFRKLRKHDINIAVNWMVGLPSEGYDDMLRTVQCIREGLKLYDYNIDEFKLHIYRFVPFPGTPIFNELERDEIDRFPKSAKEWGTYIYEKVSDGLKPWEEENGPSMFASTTFFLWKAYLQREKTTTLAGKLLRKISKFRIDNSLLRLPLEWWLWKRLKLAKPVYKKG